MPQDAFNLKFLCKELNILFSGGKVNRIIQPSNDELVITIYTKKGTHKLLLDVNPSAPRIGICSIEKASPLTAPNFCMLMRKHLLSSTLESVTLVGFDRIVKLDFLYSGEFFEPVRKTVYVELMGRYSNIILTEDGKILGGNRGINLFEDVVRPLIVNKPYKFPPVGDKKTPFDDQLIEYFDQKKQEKIAESITSGVQGVALSTAREIEKGFILKHGENKGENYGKNLFEYLNFYIENVRENPCVMIKDGKAFDVCIYPYNTMNFDDVKYFESLLKAEDYFFTNRNAEKQFKTKKDRLINVINTAIKKTKKRLTAIKSRQNEAVNAEENKIIGEIILANIYKIKQGDSECVLDDYYTGKTRKVELNPYKSPAQNAESYFKKYSKQKRTLEMLAPQIEQSEQDLKYYQSILEEINFSDDLLGLDAIKDEMTESGLIKEQKKNVKQNRIQSFRCYKAYGFSIKAGRNNVENDKLLREAKPEDIWVHAKSEHSAFVIIETEKKELQDELLKVACEICAYYSSGRDGGKVEIVYTKRKNVKKPPKSKPGFVIYENFKSITVNPKKHAEFYEM